MSCGVGVVSYWVVVHRRFYRGSDIALMGGLFFRGFPGISIASVYFSKGVVSYNWQRGLRKVGKRTL